MKYLLETIPELMYYLNLLPIILVGLFSGLASYYKDEKEGDKKQKHLINASLTSCFLCFLTYSLLSDVNSLGYVSKVGIAAAVGYFGIDKTLDLIQKIFEIIRQSKQS